MVALHRRLACTLLATCLLAGAGRALAACGDATIDQNEECDPGGGLFINGDPGQPSCSTGTDCFFEASCCKFNCQFVGSGAPCFDANDCTTNDTCDQVGVCEGGTPSPNGTPCDDGFFCTVGDACNGSGSCVSGGGSPCTAVECQGSCNESTDGCEILEGAPCSSDGNLCTDDVCDQNGSCTHPSNTAPCDDGVFCNGADTCAGSSCSVHAGDPCAGGTQCADTCSETLDTCNLPDGTSCDDGLFCTAVDACTAGTCTGSGDPCAGAPSCADACDELLDTCDLPNGTPCDDGLFCTALDACAAGTCVGAGDPCAGGPQCADTCNETLDTCNLPDGASCNDGLFCTALDVCVTGACVGSGDACASGGECADTCDEDLDTCNLPGSTLCTDDGNLCTDDACDGAGTCAHPANNEPCDDGLLCTLVDVCENGACVGMIPPQCQDGNPCTFDSCDDVSGDCVNLEEPNPACREAGLAQLVIRNRDDIPGKDKLKWKWSRSLQTTDQAAFGTPDTTTTYDLCIYDTSTDLSDVVTGRLVARLSIPPSPSWDERGSNKWLYKNLSGPPDGITLAKLRSGGAGAIGLKAAPNNLNLTALGPDVFFAQDPTVAVQLSNSEGQCWFAEFDTAKKNTVNKFRTKFLGLVIQ